jgi:hypothetical protein
VETWEGNNEATLVLLGHTLWQTLDCVGTHMYTHTQEHTHIHTHPCCSHWPVTLYANGLLSPQPVRVSLALSPVLASTLLSKHPQDPARASPKQALEICGKMNSPSPIPLFLYLPPPHTPPPHTPATHSLVAS